METGILNNKVVKLAMDAVDKLLTKDVIGEDKRWAREILAEFRAMREEERKDFGDDVKRIETRGQLVIGGEVSVTHTTHDASFKDFITAKLDDGVIDVDALEDTDEAELLPVALEQVLIEGEILDVIEEEDRAEEIALEANK